MRVITKLTPSDRPTSTALGYFDGVHKGHRAVIKEAVETAEREDLVPSVFTLQQSPRTVLRGEKSCNILTTEKKLGILSSLGVEQVWLIDFCTIKDITAESFVSDILKGVFNCRHVSCGFNYHFGAGAKGSGEILDEMCRSYDISVLARPRIIMGDKPVSSTRIRECIRHGEVRRAGQMLGEPYGFELPVIHGRELGRKLGTPTLNMKFPEGLVCPLFGAYASAVTIDGKSFCGVTDIGVKPTVGSDEVLCETWMPDYTGEELYGRTLRIDLIDFLRPEVRFSSVEELQREILKNGETAKEIYSTYRK